MTRDEALALHRELDTLIGSGPGGINDQARTRLRAIDFAFQIPEVDSYLRGKVSQACNYLEIWLSPRKWQRWGRDPRVFEGIVRNTVAGVRMAINETFPEIKPVPK